MTGVACAGVARFVWSRYRLMLVACALLYVALYAASVVFTPQETRPYWELTLTLLRLAPFLLPVMLFVSTVSVFTLDLASPESRYPRQFLSLPLTTQQLVLPFMAGAVLLAAVLWTLAIVISDGRVMLAGPLDLPKERLRQDSWFPFLLAGFIAWTQTLVWMSFSRRRTRIWALLGLVVVYASILVLAASGRASNGTAMFVAAVLLLLAYPFAVWGMARARCGEPPANDMDTALPDKPRRRRVSPHRPFSSPLVAQTWFEWHAHGARNKSPFLLLVPLVMALSLAVAWVANGDMDRPWSTAELATHLITRANGLVVTLAFIALLTGPPAASFQSSVQWYHNETFAMPPFFAALPLSTGDFAWAKMKTAARAMATLIGIFVLMLVPITALLGAGELWSQLFSALRDHYGAIEASVRLAFVPAACSLIIVAIGPNVVWTGLLGRGWIIASWALSLAGLALAACMMWVQHHPEWFVRVSELLRASLPWLAAIKIAALAWLAYTVWKRRHYTASRVALIAGCWAGAIAAIAAMSIRILPEIFTSTTVLASGLIVAMPVLGIFAAPLALQLNRAR